MSDMNVNRLFSTFRTASSGMAAQRQQISTAAENIANANTTRTEDGSGPYRPKTLHQSTGDRRDFENMLRDSLLDLRQTRFEHLEKPGQRSLMSGSETRDHGPQTEVVEMEKYRYEFDPHHPDADENGMVKYPDLDLVEEMTRMVSANRLFEANLSVIEAEKNIIRRAFEIS